MLNNSTKAFNGLLVMSLNIYVGLHFFLFHFEDTPTQQFSQPESFRPKLFSQVIKDLVIFSHNVFVDQQQISPTYE